MPKATFFSAVALAILIVGKEADARPYAGISGLGSLEGEFTQRDTLLFQIGMTWGSL